MKSCIALMAFVVLLPAAAFASIDGTVVNRTTEKPQANVTVTLVKPGQGGMKTLGTAVSDASGKFLFEKDQPGGGPQLLQANYAGVNYNKLMTPNIPTANVELDVYEATKSAAVARVSQRMLIFEPNASQLAVSETVVMENPSDHTYNNDELGGLRFFLPPAANGQVRISAQGPGGMPLPRPAEKTREDDVYKVQFPIKPGSTEFQISYVLPVGSPFQFRGRVVGVPGMPAGPLRLVAPPGVTLSSNDIQAVGTEPKTQANIYNVTAPNLFSVDVAGTGSFRQDDSGGQDNDSPPVTQSTPAIYRHLPLLVALAFSVLTVGLIFLFQSSPDAKRS